MTKKSRTTQATPDDTEVELASPPCLINEVDPAYMGLDVPEDRPAASRRRRSIKSPGGKERQRGKLS